jgi:succinyl-CoA synthetase beta subunit
MQLYEYQAKLWFSRYGISVPRGKITSVVSDVREIVEKYDGQAIIKAQVLASGRSKAGGIRLARSVEEAEEIASTILSMTIKGQPVNKIMVEEVIRVAQEYYIGITIDRSSHRPALVFSTGGGTDLEMIAQRDPDQIATALIDPLVGLRDYQIREVATLADFPRTHWRVFTKLARGLWKVFYDCDATLAEVNPLVITPDGGLVALDSKMIVDENAMFRHPEFIEMRDYAIENSFELDARKHDLDYIKLEGDIGCMANGAGLAMAAMDLIKLSGGEPANFMDIGGGASAAKVCFALSLLFSDPGIKAVLINIFGGLTQCDEVARGILMALKANQSNTPIVVRFSGTDANKGWKLIESTSAIKAETLFEASQKVIQAAKAI